MYMWATCVRVLYMYINDSDSKFIGNPSHSDYNLQYGCDISNLCLHIHISDWFLYTANFRLVVTTWCKRMRRNILSPYVKHGNFEVDMPKAYSVYFRWWIVWTYLAHHSTISELAHTFHMFKRTIRCYIELFYWTGDVTPRKGACRPKKLPGDYE